VVEAGVVESPVVVETGAFVVVVISPLGVVESPVVVETGAFVVVLVVVLQMILSIS